MFQADKKYETDLSHNTNNSAFLKKPNNLFKTDLIFKKNIDTPKKPLEVSPLSHRLPRKKNENLQNFEKFKSQKHIINNSNIGNFDPETDIIPSTTPKKKLDFSSKIPKFTKTKSIQHLNLKNNIKSKEEKVNQNFNGETKPNSISSFLNLDKETVDFLFLLHCKKGEFKQAISYLNNNRLKHHADVNKVDSENWTAIHYSIIHKNLPALKEICNSQGVDINVRGKGGVTPFILAALK